MDHLDFSPDFVQLNDFSIRTHFKHLTRTFLESFELYWTFDVRQPTLMKAWNEKEFLKSIDKQNKFCRHFMNGKLDKTKDLYKRFVQTGVFRNYDKAKRQEVIDFNLN